MSQAALRTTRAKTEQTSAERLAELRAAFEAFGAKPEQAVAAVRLNPAPAAPAPNRAALPQLKRPRWRARPVGVMRAIQALDWIVVALTAEFAARWSEGIGIFSLSLGDAGAYLAAALSLKLGLWATNAYAGGPAKLRADHNAGGLALGAIAGIVIATIWAPDSRAAAALGAILPFAAILLAGLHALAAIWGRAADRAGSFSETIVLIGATEAAARLAANLRRSGEARVVAVVDDRLARAPYEMNGVAVCGSIDDLLTWPSLPEVDRIVITVTQKAEARVRALIERMRIAPNRIDLLIDYDAEHVSGGRVDRFATAPFACVSGRPHCARRALVKRIEDIVIGGALLAVFAPVMLVIATLVKLDSKGPVIYRQRRHGFNNRVITVYKFRSMRHDPGAALQQVCADDPRVTRIGKFLRRTSLDELPQLLNVLRGEMSLVGPRPHAVGMRAGERDLTHIVAEYAHRHRVKPGITGWAQVNGSRGPIETDEAVRARVQLDLDYVSRASLWLDLMILLRTAPALLGDRKATR